jgi:hypothetical protein
MVGPDRAVQGCTLFYRNHARPVSRIEARGQWQNNAGFAMVMNSLGATRPIKSTPDRNFANCLFIDQQSLLGAYRR